MLLLHFVPFRVQAFVDTRARQFQQDLFILTYDNAQTLTTYLP